MTYPHPTPDPHVAVRDAIRDLIRHRGDTLTRTDAVALADALYVAEEGYDHAPVAVLMAGGRILCDGTPPEAGPDGRVTLHTAWGDLTCDESVIRGWTIETL